MDPKWKARLTRFNIPATNTVLILLCAMYALTYVDRVNVSTASLVFKRDLHLSNTEVGLVFSAFAYPYLIFTSLGGWLSDKFGARLALSASAIIWGVATLVTGMTTTLSSMLFARALLGVGEAATFPIATKAMADWLPENKRGFAQGITHSSSRLGTAITPPLVAWLMAVVTWRGSFFLLGVLSLLWASLWALYFRDRPATHPLITARELASLPTFSPEEEARRRSIPWVPLARRMAPVTAVYFCYGWTLWLYLAWIPGFFQHNYQLDLKNSALFSSGVLLAGVGGDTLGGVASDLVLRRTGDRNRSRRDLVVAGFVLSLLSMLLMFFTHNVYAAAICLSMAFFFSEFTVGPMWAIPMDIAPSYSGSASGLMNIGSPLAAIISPLVFGYLIDKTGNWHYPFAGSIAVLLLGTVGAYWMKPEQRFEAPAS